MKIKILIIGSLTLAIGFMSCKKFLNVEPKTSLSDSQLFSSEQGFQQALNGVYAQLASRNLYGDKMTMGFMSALAQNYALTTGSIDLIETVKLNYTSPEVQNHVSNIWSTAYSAIAGVNKILANAEEHKQVFTDQNYGLIRGEALALRAFLHFDLLRLFGKEYGAGANLKAIPYKIDVSQNANVPVTTAEVAKFALADLKQAEDLLKNIDPIVTLGTLSRKNKLNYYAVKALEARIRLYIDDKAGAAAAANIVINSNKYTFVTPAQASALSTTTTTRDRLYFNEQIFMVRVRDMVNWTEIYFRFNGATNMKLTRSLSNFNTLYEVPGTGLTADIRYNYRIEDDGGNKFPSKYWQTTSSVLDSTRIDQYVPAIRLSEMYYILAETAENPAVAIPYLNTVRRNRGLTNLVAGTPAALRTEITKEHEKEFYAEGQLFFYYKRIKATTMRFRSTAMTAAQYVLPIPDAELEFNPNY